MNRKFLEGLGINNDVIDKVLAESGKTSDELESVKAELEAANKTVSERDKQLKELQKSAEGNEELSKKIKELERFPSWGPLWQDTRPAEWKEHFRGLRLRDILYIFLMLLDTCKKIRI